MLVPQVGDAVTVGASGAFGEELNWPVRFFPLSGLLEYAGFDMHVALAQLSM